MSSFLYGSVTRNRLDVPPGENTTLAYAMRKRTNVGEYVLEPIVTETAAKPAPDPAVTKALDVVTAIVPAEVLAIHGAIIGLVGASTTHKGALQLTWWVLTFLPAVLYMMGKRKFDILDYRPLIPCAAFVVWTILQRSIAFDAVWGEIDPVTGLLIGLVGALLLGGGTYGAAAHADNQKPPE